jgi:hypothetical protein
MRLPSRASFGTIVPRIGGDREVACHVPLAAAQAAAASAG